MKLIKKTVFGKPLYYPDCELSKEFASNLGTTTFSVVWIKFLRDKMGVEIIITANSDLE